MCPNKKNTDQTKIADLGMIFSGEFTSYTDTSYCINILWEICSSTFSGPPCITCTACCSICMFCISFLFFHLSSYTSVVNTGLFCQGLVLFTSELTNSNQWGGGGGVHKPSTHPPIISKHTIDVTLLFPLLSQISIKVLSLEFL